MKIIPIITIFLLATSKNMAQNTFSTQKDDNHHIALIKAAFYESKLDEVKELPFFKSMYRQIQWRKIKNNKTLSYNIITKLMDTTNQQIVIQIGCDGMPLSEKNSDGRNILALFDTKTDSLISILGTNAFIGFRHIQLTADYIIATNHHGLLAWNQITGELYGKIYHHPFITPIIHYEDSNKVFLRFGGREPQASFLFDIDQMKKVEY